MYITVSDLIHELKQLPDSTRIGSIALGYVGDNLYIAVCDECSCTLKIVAMNDDDDDEDEIEVIDNS